MVLLPLCVYTSVYMCQRVLPAFTFLRYFASRVSQHGDGEGCTV